MIENQSETQTLDLDPQAVSPVINPEPITNPTVGDIGTDLDPINPDQSNKTTISAEFVDQQINPIINQELDLNTQAQIINDANATPLINADPLENYPVYASKVNQNYQTIASRNSITTTTHLATYTQLYLSDQKDYPFDDVHNKITNFINVVAKQIASGMAIQLSPILTLYDYQFKDQKVNQCAYVVSVPNSKVPITKTNWQDLVNQDDFEIIETYLKIFNNLLAKNYDCEFFPNTVLVQHNHQQISIYFPTNYQPNQNQGQENVKKRSKKS